MSYHDLIFPLDYIIIIISILFTIIGFWKGFINSLLGLLTWVGSVILTIYTYGSLSSFLSNQLLTINLFKNYEQITNLIGTTISIPLIFLISLFILKKIRKILSTDLDKQILGIIFDKLFGAIYGIIFSYIVFSTIIYSLDNFDYFYSLYKWFLNNSYILEKIDLINKNIYSYIFFNPLV